MFKLSILGLSVFLLLGCIPEDAEQDNDFGEFNSIPFNILSQGTQNDVPGGRFIEVRNLSRFTDVIQEVPSMSDVITAPDFEQRHAVFVFTDTDACSSLDISDISENAATVLITATITYSTSQPFCDQENETSNQLNYVILDYQRTGMKASILYKTKFIN